MLQTKEPPVSDINKQYAGLQLDSLCAHIKRQALTRTHPRLKFAIENHLTSKGERLDFSQRKFLIPLYRDDSQKIVGKKPTQVGMSEYLNVRTFEAAKKNLSTFFVLPKQTLRNNYVKTRIDPLIQQCYSDIMLDEKHGSVMLKKCKNNANMVFVGSNAESEFVSMPCDQKIVDEYSYCTEENLPLAKKRLGASDHKLELDVGTPTAHGKGIDIPFNDTDQNKWHLTCTHCGTRQIVSFFGNVLHQGDNGWEPIDSGLNLHCGICNGLMDRLADGEYVATYDGRDISGYHIPALCVPTKPLDEIYDNWLVAQNNEFEKQVFMNCDLGESYTAEGAKITIEMLDRCKGTYTSDTPNININDRCTMGIDVGNYFHIRISRLRNGKREAIYIDKLSVNDESIREILRLIKSYRVRRGVIDARPEQKLSKDISDLSHGVIWRCDYMSNDSVDELYKMDKDNRLIKTHRTWSINEMVEDVKRGRLVLPGNAHTVCNGEYYEQMQAPTLLMVKTQAGRPRYVWDEGNNPDHFFHAENYDKIAQMMLGAMYEGTIDKDSFQPALHDRGVNQFDEEFSI